LDRCVEGRDIEGLEEDLSSDIAVFSRIQRWFCEEYWVLYGMLLASGTFS
jgi:hypothetical protein